MASSTRECEGSGVAFLVNDSFGVIGVRGAPTSVPQNLLVCRLSTTKGRADEM